MICNNCPDDLIPLSDKGLVYTGENIPSLNIKTGDNYDSVINKLIAAIPVESKESGKKVTTDDIDSNTNLYSLVSNKSICGTSIVSTSFDFSVENTATGVKLTYDINSVINNLPQGISLAVSNIKIIGNSNIGPVIIANTPAKANTISIPGHNLPVTMNIDLILNSSCGAINMKSEATIPMGIVGSFKGILNVTSTPDKDAKLNLTQVNEILTLELAKIKLELDTIKSTIFEHRFKSDVINTFNKQ